MARIETSGVYRHPDGTAVYLAEGEEYPDDVLKTLTRDDAASKDRLEAKEPDRFGFTTNAPQEQEQKSLGAAPENKSMSGAPQQKSDAQLADDAAKRRS